MSRARWPFVAGALNCGLVTTVAVGLLVADEGEPDAVQPIPFNHAIHLEAEVDCVQCHAGIVDKRDYRLPTLDTCTMCHFDDPEDNEGLLKLAEFAASGEPIPWNPLFRVPDHVYFSHVRHVEVGELACEECHADMPARTTPPLYARTMSMERCIECHEEHADHPSARRAIRDCAACHR